MRLPAGCLVVLVLVFTVGCLGGDTAGWDDGVTPSDVSTATPTPTSTSTSTPTPTDEPTGGPTATPTTDPEPVPFDVTIDALSDCGDTCRDVNATLTNDRERPASNVSVEMRLFAGNGTDGQPLWTDSETVGSLDAGESVAVDRRIALSASEAIEIDRADGWVTIEAIVTADGETVTVTRRRNVL